MRTTKQDTYYCGPRAAMIAECTTPDFYKGKYLLQQVGDDMYDAEGFDTKAAMLARARELVKYYNAQIVYL